MYAICVAIAKLYPVTILVVFPWALLNTDCVIKISGLGRVDCERVKVGEVFAHVVVRVYKLLCVIFHALAAKECVT